MRSPWTMVRLLRCIWFVFSRQSDAVMSGCACRMWNSNSDLPSSSRCLPTHTRCPGTLNIDQVNYCTAYQNKKKRRGMKELRIQLWLRLRLGTVSTWPGDLPVSLPSPLARNVFSRTEPGIWHLLLYIPFKLLWWQGKISLLSPVRLMTVWILRKGCKS